MRKLYLVVIATIMVPYLCFSQMQSVNITNISACGGATIIGQPVFDGTPNPTTLYFERQGAAGTWFEVRSMPYDWQSNYITLTPTDVTQPTNYRVRAVDMVTFAERISPGTAVNPATWNIDRGTAFGTAIAYWGSTCNNAENTLQVTTNYTTNGRPPFRIEYKKAADVNYTVYSTVTAGAIIPGIEPGVGYQVRITDYCGKVVNTSANVLNIAVSGSSVAPTTCDNGRLTILTSGDSRSRGIPPYRYGITKRVAGMGGLNPVIAMDSTSPTFNNLGPGDYFIQAEDACGNKSRIELVRLGNGFPYVQNFIFSIPSTDSCVRNITVIPINGQPPVEYGVRFIHDASYTWQASPTFTLNKSGAWYFKTRDACGQISDSLHYTFTIPEPVLDSVVALSGKCIKDLKVYAKDGYKPYTYGIRRYGSSQFVFQSSDTFTEVTPGQHFIVVRDRCGKETASFLYNDIGPGCDLMRSPGTFESSSTVGCPDLSGNEWIDMKNDNNELIFSINPQGNSLPATCWGVRVVPRLNDTLRVDTINGRETVFLDRNFYIEPQAGTTLTGPVMIRLYIQQGELDWLLLYLRLNGYPNATINDLRILKKKGSPGSPVDLDVVNDGAASAGDFTVITPVIKPYVFGDYILEFSVNDFSEFNPSAGQEGALPLTLVAFTAKAKNNKVALNWTTTDEVNTGHFDIQWSETGSDFKKLSTINSNNRPGINKYDYTHTYPGNGSNYYRLKQVDKDGKFTYSTTIAVTVDDNLSGITVYPNPVSERLLINVSPGETIRAISITDAAGRLQLRKAQTNNTRPFTLDVQQLSRGIYWLRVQTDRKTYNLKFIRR